MACKQSGWEQDEFVLAKHKGIEVRSACFPYPPSYIRVVDTRRAVERELMYWCSDEWQGEDTDLSCIGAIFAVIGTVRDGTFNPNEDIYQSHADAQDDYRE